MCNLTKPTIEEIESDILSIISTLSSDITTLDSIAMIVIRDTKQFEKGINKQIARFEELRDKVRMLNKLRSKKK